MTDEQKPRQLEARLDFVSQEHVLHEQAVKDGGKAGVCLVRGSALVVLIQTERLVLREYTQDDCTAVLAYQSDPRYLRLYPWTERDLAAVNELIGGFVARQADEPRDVFQLAITLPAESGRLIGSCGVRVNDRARREGNIGYELDPAYWRQGYATEAARAMLSYGFERLGLHRIWAQANDENTASAHVLEKLGMRCEAHFLEHDYFKGRWWGSLIYAMLDREWRAVTSPG